MQLISDPQIIFRTEHLNCNALLNYQQIRSNTLKQFTNDMKESLDKQMTIVITEMEQYLQNYQDKCEFAVQQVFNRIKWNQFHQILSQIQSQNPYLSNDDLNTRISVMLNEYISLEQSDEYKELNESMKQQHQVSQQNIDLLISQINSCFTESLQSLQIQSNNIFQTRHLSKQEESAELQQQLIQKEQQMEEDEKNQLIEQIEELQELVIDLLAPSYEFIEGWSNKLFDRIRNDIDEIPCVAEIMKFDSYSQYDDFLKQLNTTLPTESFIVFVKTTDCIIGCYYPSTELKREDLLFVCTLTNFEFQPIYDLNLGQRHLKIVVNERGYHYYGYKDTYKVSLCEGKLEIQKEKIEKSCFKLKQTAYSQMIIIKIE